MAAELKKCFKIVENRFYSEELFDYIVKEPVATRNNGDIFLGASPRGIISYFKTAKAMAAINGRDLLRRKI